MSKFQPRKFPQLYDREWVVQNYVTERRSPDEIAAELGCTGTSVRDALKRLGIPKRSAVETRDLTLQDVTRWRDGGGVQARHPIGPTEHKAAAEELGLSTVDDLIVLSRHHDPFYCGTPAQIQDAEWFEALWKEHGSLGHLRRLHYRLVSGEEQVTFDDGKPYLNDEYSFGRLCIIGCSARHLDNVKAGTSRTGATRDPILNAFQRVTGAIPGAEVE